MPSRKQGMRRVGDSPMADRHTFWDLLVFYGFLGVILANVATLVILVLSKTH